VQSDGSIAKVSLKGDVETGGTKINIIGDQVDINNITFDKEAGTIASDNYEAGSAGWQIDGQGNAEFNDVVIRGKLGDTAVEGTVSVTSGKISVTDGSVETVNTFTDGLDYRVTTSMKGGIIDLLKEADNGSGFYNEEKIEIGYDTNSDVKISLERFTSSGRKVTIATSLISLEDIDNPEQNISFQTPFDSFVILGSVYEQTPTVAKTGTYLKLSIDGADRYLELWA